LLAWASTDFFPGEGKIFRGGGGQKHTNYLKTPKNILFSSKKVKKHTILAGQGGQGPPLALPCGRPWLLVGHCVLHSSWEMKKEGDILRNIFKQIDIKIIFAPFCGVKA
jgi:hypothetical protein